MKNIFRFFSVSIFVVLTSCSSTPKTENERIKDAIGSSRGAVRSCYLDALESIPATHGRLVLFWTVMPNGQAQNIEVVESTLNNKGLEACVIKVVSKIHFPERSSSQTVKYPFVFQK